MNYIHKTSAVGKHLKVEFGTDDIYMNLKKGVSFFLFWV